MIVTASAAFVSPAGGAAGSEGWFSVSLCKFAVSGDRRGRFLAKAEGCGVLVLGRGPDRLVPVAVYPAADCV